MKKPISRRALLRGAGGVGIALPFLDAMWAPGRAHAQAKPARRLFVVVGHNGVVPGTWFPTGSETNFTLGPSLMPFEPLKENLIILDGITKMQRGTTDGTAHGRGSAGALTGHTTSGKNGIADGPSIDQAVANVVGGATRLKSLMLGRPTNYHFLHSGPKQVFFPEPDPAKTFDRLFTGFSPPAAVGGPGAGPNLDLEKLRARKKSILDAAREQYAKVAGQVGAGDKRRLDVHAEAIRQVELQIDKAGATPVAATAACAKPAGAPSVIAGDYQQASKADLDLIALAFACDATRVAGRQYTSHGQIFNWLGVTEKHHPLAHQTGNAGADAQLTKIVGWHAAEFSGVLQKLKAMPDVGGNTVLDNTIFLWTHSVSVGSHKFDRGSFLLVSGKFPAPNGKTLQTGRYLKYGGTPHTAVLLSIAQLMGLTITSFGASDWQKGPLPNLI